MGWLAVGQTLVEAGLSILAEGDLSTLKAVLAFGKEAQRQALVVGFHSYLPVVRWAFRV